MNIITWILAALSPLAAMAATPYLEPVTQKYIDSQNSSATPLYNMTVSAARAMLHDAQAKSNPSLNGFNLTSIQIPVGPTGSVNVSIFKPSDASDLVPVIAYFHGGGWILGDPVTHQRLVQDLINETGFGVFFVYYSPSPEAQFPVPIEQAYSAVQWLKENGEEYGLDSSKLAFAGDSAGGAMSAAVNLLSIQRNVSLPAYQVLFYPVSDLFRTNWTTFKEFENGPGLGVKTLEWMVNAFCPKKEDRLNPLASPLRADTEDLARMPPTLVIMAEVDPLREQGDEFAKKLAESGVDVSTAWTKFTVHDFVMLNALAEAPGTTMALELVGVKLKKALGDSVISWVSLTNGSCLTGSHDPFFFEQ